MVNCQDVNIKYAVLSVAVAFTACAVADSPVAPSPVQCSCALTWGHYTEACWDAVAIETRPISEYQHGCRLAPEPPTPIAVDEIVVRANHRGSSVQWSAAVRWTPAVVANCAWSSSGGASITDSDDTGRGTCRANIEGTPSGGDLVIVTVVGPDGVRHHRSAPLD